MKDMGVKPDLISFNTMLDTAAKEIGVKGKVNHIPMMTARFYRIYCLNRQNSLQPRLLAELNSSLP